MSVDAIVGIALAGLFIEAIIVFVTARVAHADGENAGYKRCYRDYFEGPEFMRKKPWPAKGSTLKFKKTEPGPLGSAGLGYQPGMIYAQDPQSAYNKVYQQVVNAQQESYDKWLRRTQAENKAWIQGTGKGHKPITYRDGHGGIWYETTEPWIEDGK